MASGPITSWQVDGETMETVTDFIFLGSKVIVDQGFYTITCDVEHFKYNVQANSAQYLKKKQ